ncbi:hypothetical protein IKG02_01960 [Candidatus Saccharibacteria bacterium]|nr:hypothetical protein [Candidatus Saccharibacteria bacterium]
MTDKKFSKSANFFIVIAALIALSVILAFFYFSFDGTGRLQWLLTFHNDELTDFAENFLKGDSCSKSIDVAKKYHYNKNITPRPGSVPAGAIFF